MHSVWIEKYDDIPPGFGTISPLDDVADEEVVTLEVFEDVDIKNSSQ
jgi:hypothetical protein